MSKRNRNLFNDVLEGVGSNKEVKEDLSKPKKTSYLKTRNNELSDIFDGNIQEKSLRWVDPAVCKMWEHHNRRYDLLNEDRCRDLIEGIKSQGTQEFPAVVRKVDHEEYEYEVICGARRHWTISYLRVHNYPSFKFLIDVRNLSDEEAFRLSDVENRDKEDISDYERALDYKKALRLYYKSQKEMANRLQVSEAWLSYFLQLSEFPKPIVDLFSDINFVKIETARFFKPTLKDAKSRKELLEYSEILKSKKVESNLDDTAILKNLKDFIKPQKSSNSAKITYCLPDTNKTLFTLEKKRSGELSIKAPSVEKKNISQFVERLLLAIDELDE